MKQAWYIVGGSSGVISIFLKYRSLNERVTRVGAFLDWPSLINVDDPTWRLLLYKTWLGLLGWFYDQIGAAVNTWLHTCESVISTSSANTWRCTTTLVQGSIPESSRTRPYRSGQCRWRAKGPKWCTCWSSRRSTPSTVRLQGQKAGGSEEDSH